MAQELKRRRLAPKQVNWLLAAAPDEEIVQLILEYYPSQVADVPALQQIINLRCTEALGKVIDSWTLKRIILKGEDLEWVLTQLRARLVSLGFTLTVTIATELVALKASVLLASLLDEFAIVESE